MRFLHSESLMAINEFSTQNYPLGAFDRLRCGCHAELSKMILLQNGSANIGVWRLNSSFWWSWMNSAPKITPWVHLIAPVVVVTLNYRKWSFCRMILQISVFCGRIRHFEGHKWIIHAKIPPGAACMAKNLNISWKTQWIKLLQNDSAFWGLFWGAWSNFEGHKLNEISWTLTL